MKALQSANVETVIICRSLAPICVSVLEWFFLGRELPNVRSTAALVGIVVGAAGYVHAEASHAVSGSFIAAYGWSLSYLLCIVFSMTEGKRLLLAVNFNSPVWGATYYTNVLCCPGLLLLAFVTGEAQKLPT